MDTLLMAIKVTKQSSSSIKHTSTHPQKERDRLENQKGPPLCCLGIKRGEIQQNDGRTTAVETLMNEQKLNPTALHTVVANLHGHLLRQKDRVGSEGHQGLQ
jgi:hypothetical protein